MAQQTNRVEIGTLGNYYGYAYINSAVIDDKGTYYSFHTYFDY